MADHDTEFSEESLSDLESSSDDYGKTQPKRSPQQRKAPKALEDDDSGISSGESEGSEEDQKPSKVGRAPIFQQRRPEVKPMEPIIVRKRNWKRVTTVDPGETDDQKDLRDSIYKVLLTEKYSEERADLLSQKFINKKYKGSTFSPEDEKELIKVDELFFGTSKK